MAELPRPTMPVPSLVDDADDADDAEQTSLSDLTARPSERLRGLPPLVTP